MSDRVARSRDGHLRPTLASSVRRDWKAFFLQEWSLLLLAAAMTLTIWLNVREQVRKDYDIDHIRVELVVNPAVRQEVGAVLGDKDTMVSIKLRCSKRERDEAERALKGRGGRKTVKLDVRKLGDSAFRAMNEKDDVFEWPFDDVRILTGPPEMPDRFGWVFRISPQTAAVVAPATQPDAQTLERDHGLRVSIVPSERNVTMLVPAGFFDEPLTPDPIAINPSEHAEAADGDPGAPLEMPLRFERWRKRSESEVWKGVYRSQFKLPPINAKITVTQIGKEAISNALVVQLDGNRYEYSFERESLENVSNTDPLTYEGTLSGPKPVLQALKDDPAGWGWGIRLKEDPAEKLLHGVKDSAGFVTVTGEIVWLPFEGFVNRGVRHEQQTGEGSFQVKVKKR